MSAFAAVQTGGCPHTPPPERQFTANLDAHRRLDRRQPRLELILV